MSSRSGGATCSRSIPADVDPAGTQTLEQLAGTTVARLEQALGEAVEMRTPGRLLWGGGLALLATLVLVVLLRVLFRTHAATTRAVTGSPSGSCSGCPAAS